MSGYDLAFLETIVTRLISYPSDPSLEEIEDEESLFRELEEEDDHETSQFRERRFQEIQAEYDRNPPFKVLNAVRLLTRAEPFVEYRGDKT